MPHAAGSKPRCPDRWMLGCAVGSLPLRLARSPRPPYLTGSAACWLSSSDRSLSSPGQVPVSLRVPAAALRSSAALTKSEDLPLEGRCEEHFRPAACRIGGLRHLTDLFGRKVHLVSLRSLHLLTSAASSRSPPRTLPCLAARLASQPDAPDSARWAATKFSVRSEITCPSHARRSCRRGRPSLAPCGRSRPRCQRRAPAGRRGGWHRQHLSDGNSTLVPAPSTADPRQAALIPAKQASPI